MMFEVSLAGGGSLRLGDYSSVGEVYKQQIADFYTPLKPGTKTVSLKPGIVPKGMEDFRVWLPARGANGRPSK